MSFPVVKISNVLKLEYGKALPDSDRDMDGLYAAYGANGEKTRTNKFLYSEPSIIVGRKGSAGELTLVKNKFWALDVTYYVTHNKSETDLYYLYYALQTMNLTSFARGVKPGINRNDVYELEIPLPSLTTQKNIVAKLDAIFAEIDKATAAAEANAKNAEALFESVLRQAYKIKDGLKTVELGNICYIMGGGTPSKSNPNFYIGDIPWATVRDMNNDYLEETDFKINKEAVKESSTNIIPKNNVVIATRVGLGKVCILKQDTAINQDLRGVVPKNQKELDVNYLFFWFKSISKIIVDAGRGATVHGVTLPFIKSLQIPLPPIALQEEIVAKLDAISEEVKKSSKSYSDKISELVKLKQSILKQAFNGELVKEEL